MFAKYSTKSLLITFLILLGIVSFFLIKDSLQGDRTFPKSIISIDTSKVTAIEIYPRITNHKAFKIIKKGNSWVLDLANNQTALVPISKVKNILSQILSIKPESVASMDRNEWKDFNVDTSGTLVKVYEGSNNSLSLVIGKFIYKQPQSMSSYIRVNSDKDVYLTNGFLDLTFNHTADYFRDNTVINDDYENWNKLTFTYPADSSFQLIRKNNLWTINGKPTDSTSTIKYLQSISNLSQYFYVNNPSNLQLGKAKYVLTIQSSALGVINVFAYSTNNKLIINSSQNSSSYFDGDKENFWQKLFISSKYLISNHK